MVFLGLSFVVCAVIASVAIAIDVDADPNLVAKLRMANTNLDRMNLLPKDSDWLFDFTKQEKYTFAPGGKYYQETSLRSTANTSQASSTPTPPHSQRPSARVSLW